MQHLTKTIFISLLFVMLNCIHGSNNQHPLYAYLKLASDATPFSVSQITPGSGVTNVPLNTSIQVTFSQNVDSSSINPQSIRLSQGNNSIPGTLSSSEASLVFTPSSPLASAMVYTVTVSKNIQSSGGVSLSDDSIWSFTTMSSSDSVAPSLSLSTPFTGAFAPSSTAIQVAFTETMNCTSINGTTFTLKNNVTNALVSGTVTCLGTSATFTPDNPLAFSTAYRVDISSMMKDLAGNYLSNSQNWVFTTSSAPDTTAPLVSFVSPGIGAQGTGVNASISVAFSEPINCASIIGNFTLDDNILVPGDVSVSLSCSGTTASITPLGALAFNTTYTAYLTNAITDMNGNPLPASNWSFTTGLAPDTTSPSVTSNFPAAFETGVGTNISPMVVFNEAMLCSSVTSASLKLKRKSTGVYLLGSVNCFGTSATWTPDPSNPLSFNTIYVVELNAGALDSFHNPAIPTSWEFTTGPGPDVIPPLVSFVAPGNGSIGAPINGSISVAFNETMNCGTILGGITMDDPLNPGFNTNILVNCSGTTATITPTSSLTFNKTYTVTIANTVTDVFNNPITPNNGAGTYTWVFTTGNAPDLTKPQIFMTNPISGASNIATNANIVVAFTETIDCSTLNLTVNNGITVTKTCSGATASFAPTTALLPGMTYLATVNTVNDLAGNPILVPFSWSFTTGAAPDVTPPTVSIQNLKSKGILESGFIIGTATDAGGIASVEISIDGGAYASVSLTGPTTWKYQLPTGASIWTQNSAHSIAVRSKDLSNNVSPISTITAVRKGTNKDVNGDGYIDLVTSEYGQGLVYVVHSSGSAGITTNNASLSSRTIVGNAAEEFGKVVTMGDLNGDGYADVIVGAPAANAAAGRTYTFHSSGNLGINISFSGFASNTINGGGAGNRFGSSLVSGDINGDGYSDLVVGAPNFNASQGILYVFLSTGNAGVTSVATGTAATTRTGGAANDLFGSTLAIGDMNGDSLADIAVGAPGVNGGAGANAGRIYTYYGGAGVLTAAVNTLTNNSVIGANAKFGLSLAVADVNGDGFSDIIGGAPLFDLNGAGSSVGTIRVFVSAGGGGISTDNIGNAPLIINGVSNFDVFGVSLTARDLNSDGRADLAIGATQNLAANSAVYVFVTPSAGGVGNFFTKGNATMSISGPALLGVSTNGGISSGDTNGDGFADLSIGGSNSNVYVFHSSAGGLITNLPGSAASNISPPGLGGGVPANTYGMCVY
ncbi:Ig-like domain-containing protein [Leptospira stimsonii]|uniref:SbsA Ig-like domain-containing protein n=1 Tax=Leptospira stimsonii TaxID=2202203 RepID=A0A8B3CQE7_9LEPT|nr:Ig-like domain-containing protein [Leptospira stimsonii]RHX86232.1 hypothetical protein DLM78_10290 [Leptospira stimsonii]